MELNPSDKIYQRLLRADVEFSFLIRLGTIEFPAYPGVVYFTAYDVDNRAVYQRLDDFFPTIRLQRLYYLRAYADLLD